VVTMHFGLWQIFKNTRLFVVFVVFFHFFLCSIQRLVKFKPELVGGNFVRWSRILRSRSSTTSNYSRKKNPKNEEYFGNLWKIITYSIWVGEF
jgi:hypothetical protein